MFIGNNTKISFAKKRKKKKKHEQQLRPTNIYAACSFDRYYKATNTVDGGIGL
jgi:hypothetical protein